MKTDTEKLADAHMDLAKRVEMLIKELDHEIKSIRAIKHELWMVKENTKLIRKHLALLYESTGVPIPDTDWYDGDITWHDT